MIVLYTVFQFHTYHTSIYVQKTDNPRLKFYIQVNKRNLFQGSDRQQEKLSSDGCEIQLVQRTGTPYDL